MENSATTNSPRRNEFPNNNNHPIAARRQPHVDAVPVANKARLVSDDHIENDQGRFPTLMSVDFANADLSKWCIQCLQLTEDVAVYFVLSLVRYGDGNIPPLDSVLRMRA